MKSSALYLLAIGVLGLAATAPAFSQTLSGQSTVINPQVGGTNCKTTFGAACADQYQFAPNNGTSVAFVKANPTTYTFADSFNQTNATSTFSDFGKQVYSTTNCPSNPNCFNSPPLTWNFQDNYDFTAPPTGPTVQGAVLSFSTANLIGLQNIEARIVDFGPNQTAGALVGTGGQVTVVDGWQSLKTPTGGPVTLFTATLETTPLVGNDEYVLEVRGEALSAASYTGSVTFAPVPLPDGLVLLLSGVLGLVGVAVLRNRPSGLMTTAIGC
jgi:hypothetical protein